MTKHEVVTPFYGPQTMAQAFPEVDPGIKPFGSRILVQIRCAKDVTDGGIYVPTESRETEKWNTQVAKVVDLGPGAFRNRDTLELWPEGSWCGQGDFVRVPKYGGDRWEVPLDPALRDSGAALFVLFNDLDIIGSIKEEHVLKIIAFV